MLTAFPPYIFCVAIVFESLAGCVKLFEQLVQLYYCSVTSQLCPFCELHFRQQKISLTGNSRAILKKHRKNILIRFFRDTYNACNLTHATLERINSIKQISTNYLFSSKTSHFDDLRARCFPKSCNIVLLSMIRLFFW